MPARIRWTRDQLLVVLNLYHKLRFGQFDQRQAVIIDLAARIGRTPSAVAMKLSNLASLDPVLKLRKIKGLEGASNLDREVWDEFHSAPAEFIPLSQERFDALFVDAETETTEVIPGTGIRRVARPPSGDTETVRPTKQRRGQGYFRDAVLNNYDNRCAVTGLPVRELLIASHILPWRDHEAERLNVRNGRVGGPGRIRPTRRRFRSRIHCLRRRTPPSPLHPPPQLPARCRREAIFRGARRAGASSA